MITPKIVVLLLAATLSWTVEPVPVCATVPDLGDLVRAVGGDEVTVTVFARGGDDPHFVEPRPSFAKALARAELVVSVGLELEIGWLPVVVGQARNPRLAAGQPGWFEAASAVSPLGIPAGTVDRSHGDVHAGGNPHFLSDPVCGVQVARALAGRLGTLRPEGASGFTARYRTFALEVGRRLLGPTVVQRAGEAAVLAALEQDALAPVIGDGADLGGWLARLRLARGARVIVDHDLWPYVARRFALEVVGFLEPKPGIPPTTRHLADLVERSRGRSVRAILAVPYFDRRTAAVVAEGLTIPVVVLAHQVGATSGASDWLSMLDHNVGQLATALGGNP